MKNVLKDTEMSNTQNSVCSYIEEYENSISSDENTKLLDWNLIKMLLINNHGWTENGASELILLIRNYGSFILSHALALSLLLKQEDGGLNF